MQEHTEVILPRADQVLYRMHVVRRRLAKLGLHELAVELLRAEALLERLVEEAERCRRVQEEARSMVLLLVARQLAQQHSSEAVN